MELFVDTIESPIGLLKIICDAKAVCAIDFDSDEERTQKLLKKRFGEVRLKPVSDPLGVSGRLRAYLAGDLNSIADIQANTGGTAFQQSVWEALRTIPAGAPISYGALAARIGRPTAFRAVGMTNSLNPVAIVVPCHRVIGSDASLTGYAGGLDRKRWLLEHEGFHFAAGPRQERMVL